MYIYIYIRIYNLKKLQVKVMQSYKTSQVGDRAGQVGGIACIIKVNERSLELSGMAVIRPRWR